MTTNSKGLLAQLKVELRATELGATVSRPVGEFSRYDLIVDWMGKLYRAQVKYADGVVSQCSGSVAVSLRKKEKCYTSSEVDVLLVYIPQLDKVCWFGSEVFHDKQNLYVRISDSKNGQIKGCLPGQSHEN